MMNASLAVMGIALYAAAAFLLTGRFFHQQGPNKPLAIATAIVAVAAHAIFLGQSSTVAPDQTMGLTNVLSIVACMTTIAMLASSKMLPNTTLLPAVFGFSALSIGITWLIPPTNVVQLDLSLGLIIHIVLSLFAYGVLVMAFLYALQMFYITYQLKHKGPLIIHSSLPPLMQVEGVLFRLLHIGTGLLFVSLVSGFVFLEHMFDKQHAHKTLLSIIALLVYLILVVGQKWRGWKGSHIVGLTITGVMLLSLGYFGSKFVREFLL